MPVHPHSVHRATCVMHRAMCIMQCASCNVHHANAHCATRNVWCAGRFGVHNFSSHININHTAAHTPYSAQLACDIAYNGHTACILQLAPCTQ